MKNYNIFDWKQKLLAEIYFNTILNHWWCWPITSSGSQVSIRKLYRVSFGAKAPPKVFFVHRMMGHTQTNILRVFLKKNEIIKFFRKWKKRKSDLYFNSWPPGQKNPTLRGSKYFRAPKYFRGTPFWDFWPLKVPKKWHFSSKTKIGPQFQFTGSWPKKSNFEGI